MRLFAVGKTLEPTRPADEGLAFTEEEDEEDEEEEQEEERRGEEAGRAELARRTIPGLAGGVFNSDSLPVSDAVVVAACLDKMKSAILPAKHAKPCVAAGERAPTATATVSGKKFVALEKTGE